MIQRFVSLTLLILLLSHCDNPSRNNQFDPLSGEYIGPFLEEATVIDGYKLQISDVFGEHIKVLSFDANLLEPLIRDIDGNGIKEAIIGTHERGKDSGKIYIIDNKGDTVAYNAKIEDSYGAPRAENDNINQFLVDNIFGSKQEYIIAISADGTWYASRLFILDKDLNLVANYWNPGGIGNVQIFQGAGGKKKLIISGSNNDLRIVAMFYPNNIEGEELPFCKFFVELDNPQFIGMLDPSNLKGEAPPFCGRDEIGTQEWYVFFLPTTVGIDKIEFTDINHDGLTEIGIWTSVGWAFYLNESGKLAERGRADFVGKRPGLYGIEYFDGGPKITVISPPEP